MILTKRFSFAFIVLLSVFLCITLTGLSNLSWPSSLPWNGVNAFESYLFLLLLLLIVATVFFKTFSNNIYNVTFAICVFISLLTATVWPLLVTITYFFASYIVGNKILDFIGFSKSKPEIVLSTLVGIGTYGSLVSILAHFKINYFFIYLLLVVIPVIHDRQKLICFVRLYRNSQSKGCSDSNPINFLIGIAICVICALYFVFALLPEVGYDSLVTHLFVPSQLANKHVWGFDVTLYAQAVMPMLADWIYSIGFILGGEISARLVNLGFIFLLSSLVYELTIWAGESEAIGYLASLLLLTTPLTFLEGSTLHIEGVWASFIVASILVLLRMTDSAQRHPYQLVLSGLLLGCALAIKALTLLYLPVVIVILILALKNSKNVNVWKFFVLAIIVFTLYGFIPYVDAFRLTNNPVFPFFNKFFQSTLFEMENFKDTRWQFGLSPDFLFSITFHSDRYQEAKIGAPGFQWLTLLVPSILFLIGLRERRGVWLCMIAAVPIVLIFIFVATYLRYIFPSVVFLIAGLAFALGAVLRKADVVSRSLIVVSWCLVFALNICFINAASWYNDFPINTLVDEGARKSYLTTSLQERASVDLINVINENRNPVVFMSSPYVAGLNADAYLASWYNKEFLNAVLAVRSEADAGKLLADRGVKYIVLDKDWGLNQYPEVISAGYFESATDLISDFGKVAVRKLRADYMYSEEVLINPDFAYTDGWVFVSNQSFDVGAHVVKADKNGGAFQQIPVDGGKKYLNKLVGISEDKQSLCRMQINWQDKNDKFIESSSANFNCYGKWTEKQFDVVSPTNAKSAVIYTVAPSGSVAKYKINSLRKLNSNFYE